MSPKPQRIKEGGTPSWWREIIRKTQLSPSHRGTEGVLLGLVPASASPFSPKYHHLISSGDMPPCAMWVSGLQVQELEARASCFRNLARLTGRRETHQGAFLFQRVKTVLIWPPGPVGFIILSWLLPITASVLLKAILLAPLWNAS